MQFQLVWEQIFRNSIPKCSEFELYPVTEKHLPIHPFNNQDNDFYKVQQQMS